MKIGKIHKMRPLQNPSYKEIKIMDNAVNQFVTNYHFCCFGGFAKVSKFCIFFRIFPLNILKKSLSVCV